MVTGDLVNGLTAQGAEHPQTPLKPTGTCRCSAHFKIQRLVSYVWEGLSLWSACEHTPPLSSVTGGVPLPLGGGGMRTAPVLCDSSPGAVGVPKCLGQRAAWLPPHSSAEEWYQLLVRAAPLSARIARAPPLPRWEIPRTVELGRRRAEFCPEEAGAPDSLWAGSDLLVCVFSELPLRRLRSSCVPSLTLLSLPSAPQAHSRGGGVRGSRPAQGLEGCRIASSCQCGACFLGCGGTFPPPLLPGQCLLAL